MSSDSISRREFCAVAGAGLVVINVAACGGSGGGISFGTDDGGAPATDGAVIDLAHNGGTPDLAHGNNPDLAQGGGACSGKVNAGPAASIAMGTAKYLSGTGYKLFACRDGGGLFALSAICTHSGCTNTFRAPNMDFYCSCHGSDFSFTGAVLRGPAVSPLVHYACCLDGSGNLLVDSTKTVASTTRI